MKRIKIKNLFNTTKLYNCIYIKGWVKTKRISKAVIFVALNDGSSIKNLQIVIDPALFSENLLQNITTGASIAVQGNIVASTGKKQSIELQALNITLLGKSDVDQYPLQPKKHSLEFLRTKAHLRFRTNTFGAVFRIRHILSYAIHQFFHEKGFLYIHTPIITSNDAEGSGELFNVTTLSLQKNTKSTDMLDFHNDFFKQKAYLTVSGQLQGEAAAMALAEIYTFGPTFRAENSNTTRHLSEFWMIEPEMAFYTLQDTMHLAENFLKYLIAFVLNNCQDDLAFLNERAMAEQKQSKKKIIYGSLLDNLKWITENSFEHITYTDAIDILRNAQPNRKKKFTYCIHNWGVDLQSEHERYLVEKYFKKPVIITDYPKKIKAFYMRQNDDEKTVAAMDILLPGIGEIIGGSQREERVENLKNAMNNLKINHNTLDWYIDTRRFGTAPHSGFGLGLERLVQFITGMDNIRDTIPFPRTPSNISM